MQLLLLSSITPPLRCQLFHLHRPNTPLFSDRLHYKFYGPSFFSASNSWKTPATVEAAIDSSILSEVEEEEEEEEEEGFIEVGYISKVHGLKGELRVKPNTDFPELRFSQPGRRWLKTRLLGKKVVSEVELTAGRSHPGQKSWIISLQGIDDIDKAKQIVGSTLLVREEDRPELEEGEIYTSDLVGMRVLLKDTGELVGKVVNVFNFGASDLLQVMLDSTKEELDHGNAFETNIVASGQLVWVPFVEAIVPEIDMDRRELHITPPKGLLELNLRRDSRSKKERRKLEWREHKKLQQRMKAAKRVLCEMGQNHLLEGLKVKEKSQKNLLARQIMKINFKLFQHALQCIKTPLDRFNLSEFISANSNILRKNVYRASAKCLSSCQEGDIDYEHHKKGLQLLRETKGAIVVVMNDNGSIEDSSDHGESHHYKNLCRLEELLVKSKSIVEVEEQGISVPLVVVSSGLGIQSYEELLLNNNYFGFDSEKVWLFEEEKLPIVSKSLESNKVLMKSSWEILQAPTGSGGVFSLLSSNKILDNLIALGIEYIQVCSVGEQSKSVAIGNPLLFGFVESRGADIGINMREGGKEYDDDVFDVIFSMRHLKRMCKDIDSLHLCPIPEKHAYMELVKEGEEWVEVVHPIPDAPNSYRLHSSIYSALNKCARDAVCIVYVSD